MWWTVLLLACSSETLEHQSPDGRFQVVSHRSALGSLIPMAPGQGSDAPGRVEIVRVEDERSCGAAKIPMVQMARDIQFAEGSATLVGVATWDLDACTVDTSDW